MVRVVGIFVREKDGFRVGFGFLEEEKEGCIYGY